MISHIPLMAIPLIVYNFGYWGVLFLGGASTWQTVVVTIPGLDDQVLPITSQDVVVLLILLCFSGEVLKATRGMAKALVDHIVSVAVLVVAMTQFFILDGGYNVVLLFIVIATLLDVIVGAIVSMKSMGRDVTIQAG